MSKLHMSDDHIIAVLDPGTHNTKLALSTGLNDVSISMVAEIDEEEFVRRQKYNRGNFPRSVVAIHESRKLIRYFVIGAAVMSMSHVQQPLGADRYTDDWLKPLAAYNISKMFGGDPIPRLLLGSMFPPKDKNRNPMDMQLDVLDSDFIGETEFGKFAFHPELVFTAFEGMGAIWRKMINVDGRLNKQFRITGDMDEDLSQVTFDIGARTVEAIRTSGGEIDLSPSRLRSSTEYSTMKAMDEMEEYLQTYHKDRFPEDDILPEVIRNAIRFGYFGTGKTKVSVEDMSSQIRNRIVNELDPLLTLMGGRGSYQIANFAGGGAYLCSRELIAHFDGKLELLNISPDPIMDNVFGVMKMMFKVYRKDRKYDLGQRVILHRHQTDVESEE